MEADYSGRLESAQAVRDYVLAGSATLTIKSVATGARFTYHVRVNDKLKEGAPPPKGPWWVDLLVGPDNGADFVYLGQVFGDGIYTHGRKSRIGSDAPGARAFAWLWRQVRAGELPSTVEVWHEGRCGRCNRKLTVPESIATGLGPICAGRMSVAA